MKYAPNNNQYQVLEKYKNKTLRMCNCVKIGQIISFNTSNQTASIKIIDITPLYSMPNEPDKLEEYPILEGVPCHFLRFGEGHISAPIQTNDFCILLFCDHTLDGWWASGTPKVNWSNTQHELSDAIAICGLGNSVNPIAGFLNALDLCFNANNRIIIQDGQITIQTPILNVNATASTAITSPAVTMSGTLSVTGALTTETGATGTFISADNKTVTVVKGIITGIG